MKTLIVTPRMVSTARAFKALGFMPMTPKQFLTLTTDASDNLLEHADDVLDIEQYNKWARSGEILVPPFLEISLDGQLRHRKVKVGQVVSHEGRHRARSVLNAGGSHLMVALVAYLNGHATTYLEREMDTHPFRMVRVRPLSIADFPTVLFGEFDQTRKVIIDHKKFKHFN